MGEDLSDELIMARRQAHQERRKEEQIQMMRLELERLKLELDTRKTMAEMGGVADVPSSGVLPKIPIMDVKNIVTTTDGAHAVIEVGGIRRSIKEGDAVGAFRVTRVDPSGVILSDENSVESRVSLRL